MHRPNPLVWLSLSVLIAGCAASTAPATTAPLLVVGELTSAAPAALPPEARALVELRTDNDPKATVVAEQRIDLLGTSWPIPFVLSVDRARLQPGERYAVRAGVASGGQALQVSDVRIVVNFDARTHVGSLQLRPVQPLAFSTAFDCGGTRALVGFQRNSMQLRVRGRAFEMRQVAAASGARYEAVDDPKTIFWNKGDRATLTLSGQTLPECNEARVALPLRAAGQEPSWRLDITAEAMMLTTDFGQKREVTSAPVRTRHEELTQFTGRLGAGELIATIGDRLCKDSMSGMPHPYTVTVRGSGRVLHGCGGEPRALLTGREWIVEDIDGKGIVDRARMTLRFDDAGRVAGLAGCNSYTAAFALSGEGLKIQPAAVTRKACAPALMQQEQRFLDALQAVERFDIAPDGALLLRGGALRSILARD